MFDKWLGGTSNGKGSGATRSLSYGNVPDGAHLKPTIISEGVVVDGDLKTDQGILHLDGCIRGAVRVTSLTVGPTGVLDGSVEATSVTVRGVVLGDVVCDDLVIDATARVSGNVRYRSLTIRGGALIDGTLNRATALTPIEAV